MIPRLLDKVFKREHKDKEPELTDEIQVERERLSRTQRKATRVLADFYRADAVIRGDGRGGRDA